MWPLSLKRRSKRETSAKPSGDSNLDKSRPRHQHDRRLSVLAEGSTATVSLNRRNSDGALIAIKEFNASATDKSSARKILAEFYVARGVQHPNVVRTWDLQVTEGRWCMSMEYYPENLLDKLSSGDLQQDKIESFFPQLVDGVAYIHNMGFAHRDIKLENLLVTEDGTVKIIDFGTVSSGKAIPTVQVGSPPYMAPELFSEKTYQPQLSDVWSVAIVYCCMILRRFPWKLATLSDVDFRNFCHLNRLIPDQRQFENDRPGTNFKRPALSARERQDSEATLVETNDVLQQIPFRNREAVQQMLQINPRHRSTMELVQKHCQGLKSIKADV